MEWPATILRVASVTLSEVLLLMESWYPHNAAFFMWSLAGDIRDLTADRARRLVTVKLETRSLADPIRADARHPRPRDEMPTATARPTQNPAGIFHSTSQNPIDPHRG